ncbi:MAG: hypothetical protein Q8S31_04905 [Alphaproteobacteria bacterium]|nr:hypothetical protein [Alphaproteobacteria bacterium]
MRLLIMFFSMFFFFQHISFGIVASSDFPYGLNEEDLSVFLMKEMRDDFKEDIASEECIKVEKLDGGGVSTQQLFKAKIIGACLVENKDKKLIIKEVSSKNTSEIENLKFVKKNKDFEKLPKDIQIVLPIGIYRVDGYGVVLNEENSVESPEVMVGVGGYIDSEDPEYIDSENAGYIDSADAEAFGKNETEQARPPLNDWIYFEIMEQAEGKEISKIFMDNYPDVNNDKNQETIKAYAKALAILHHTFMDVGSIPTSNEVINLSTDKLYYYKTFVHEDAHWGNLFYDPDNGVVRFIDNEGFASALKRKATILIDLYRVVFYSTSKFGHCRDIRYDAGKCDYSIEIGAQILKHYIENYPNEDQEKLRAYIKKYMLFYAAQNKMLMDNVAVEKWKKTLEML